MSSYALARCSQRQVDGRTFSLERDIAGTVLEGFNKKGLPVFLEALGSVSVAGAHNRLHLEFCCGAA